MNTDIDTFPNPVSPIVGKTFKARHGLKVKILREVNGWFYSDDGESYTSDGKGYHGSYFDLIEIVG
jgi:hypothetical protein